MLIPAALVALLAVGGGSDPDPVVVAWNDNLIPAGSMKPAGLTLELDIVRADWRPYGKGRAGADILAFAERGNAPTTPGPLIRVRVGTRVSTSIHNSISDTIVVHGLTAKFGLAARDSVIVPPGETRVATFTPLREGSYFYWGAHPWESQDDQVFDDGLLNGALIVDPATGPIPDDRVILIDSYTDGALPDGEPDANREVLIMNGRPWPYTERMTYAVGDSIRWRVINASVAPHPMHLHGFYFRVDARGDWRQDTVYSNAQRRMAVTELLLPGETMNMIWSPDRPGGWLFHCHLSYHAMMNPPLGSDWTDADSQFMIAAFGATLDEAQHHVERHMGGLMMVINVEGTAHPVPPATNSIRLLVRVDSDTNVVTRRYGYVLDDGSSSMPTGEPGPAPVLVLQRGEPTAITVMNTTDRATSVHWHGIEIDAYADGVVGVGGLPDMPIPAIMPGDSFVARFVPPRSGSFMYHTHISDLDQQGKGLSGAILVVDDRSSHDAGHERIFIAQSDLLHDPWLNGEETPPADTLVAGESYKLRLMNITLGSPGLIYRFVSDSLATAWTTTAKDGFDLPQWQMAPLPAERPVSIGETMDVEWTPPEGGSGWLELRSRYGRLMRRQRLEVVKNPES